MILSPVTKSLSVCLLALPQTMPAALYGLYEVPSSVGVAWSEITGEPSRTRRIDVRIVASGREPFLSPIRVPIAPHASMDEITASDVVIVTDLALAGDADPRGIAAPVEQWLRSQFDAGAMLASVCTGSIALADAGLLDGLEATTHWAMVPLFKTHFPAVRLRPERILCPAGPEHRIITSGGAASWEDLALYLIARFCSQPEAVRTAKVFLLGDRNDGQLPYSAMGRSRRHEDVVIARCQEWIADNYAGSNPVTNMIVLSGLAERTFTRRFKAASGYSPVEYVQALRIEEAKHLLETTAEATDAIAAMVGYEDPAFFRRLFKRRTGVTPARYRQRFRFAAKLTMAAAGSA
jgi:transcriptional regulator GlxA family with amidase domain